MKRVLIIFFCLSFLTGCSTLIARTKFREMTDGTLPRFYPATYMDSIVLVDSFGPNSTNKEAQQLPYRIGAVIFFLVDFPISIVTDTICLPLDILLYVTKSEEPGEVGSPLISK